LTTGFIAKPEPDTWSTQELLICKKISGIFRHYQLTINFINMKKTILLVTSLVILVSLGFVHPQKSIVGRWQVVVPDTTKIYVDLNSDGTFKNFLSGGQVVFQGKYTFKGDVFSIFDKGCNMNYPGKYKVTFTDANSIYFAVIEDSCSGRRGDVDKSTLKRVMTK
jgi:hypothetical protein